MKPFYMILCMLIIGDACQNNSCSDKDYRFRVYTKSVFYEDERYNIIINDGECELNRVFEVESSGDKYELIPILDCCLTKPNIKVYFKANDFDTVVFLSAPDTTKLFLGTRDSGDIIVGKASDHNPWAIY